MLALAKVRRLSCPACLLVHWNLLRAAEHSQAGPSLIGCHACTPKPLMPPKTVHHAPRPRLEEQVTMAHLAAQTVVACRVGNSTDRRITLLRATGRGTEPSALSNHSPSSQLWLLAHPADSPEQAGVNREASLSVHHYFVSDRTAQLLCPAVAPGSASR